MTFYDSMSLFFSYFICCNEGFLSKRLQLYCVLQYKFGLYFLTFTGRVYLAMDDNKAILFPLLWQRVCFQHLCVITFGNTPVGSRQLQKRIFTCLILLDHKIIMFDEEAEWFSGEVRGKDWITLCMISFGLYSSCYELPIKTGLLWDQMSRTLCVLYWLT